MSDVISPGDIVYIEPIKNNDKTQNITWQLSQIPNVSGSLISMDPNNGRIISLVGGYDFFLNKYNRAVQSIRQPGSNIKPFIYSAALDRNFTPASLISGAPIVIKDKYTGTTWRPENYSGKFFGPTKLRTALYKSMNLVSIRLLRSIGIPFAREYTERFGINMNRFSPTLSMALGSGGVIPIEMLTAYSTLANGGYKVQPYFIDYITDKSGNIIYQAKKPEYCDECYLEYLNKWAEKPLTEIDLNTLPKKLDTLIVGHQFNDEETENSLTYEAPRVMGRANNFLTVDMLKDVVKLGTARKALALKRNDLAGKTGTTNEYVDAWFSGFNSKIATTVWVGFDEPKTMGRGEAGSVAALPIWVDYMQTGLIDIEQDSEEIPNCERTDEFNPNGVKEYFIVNELNPDTLPTSPTNYQIEPQQPANDTVNTSNNLNEYRVEPRPQPRIIDNKEDTEGLF